MDLAGSNEGVDARLPRVSHGFPGGVDVPLVASREPADDRHMALFPDGRVPHLDGDGSHGVEVVGRGGREARLNDVDAEAGELARDDELLGTGHGGPRGLLPVAERGVEDAHVVGVVDAVRYVLRPPRRRQGSADGGARRPRVRGDGGEAIGEAAGLGGGEGGEGRAPGKRGGGGGVQGGAAIGFSGGGRHGRRRRRAGV